MSEYLERFKSNIIDFDEAKNCLASAPKDFTEANLVSCLQPNESKVFIFIDKESVWIASSSTQDVGASTFLKATVNLNPLSMVKNQAKLVKAGIDLAKGSSSYKFKQISRREISAIVPEVENSTWQFDVNDFSIVFLDPKRKRLEEIPIKFKDMSEVEKTLNLIHLGIGAEQIKYGRFVGHLDSEGILANMKRKGFSNTDTVSRSSASSLDIWENFLVATKLDKTFVSYPLTKDTKAELYVDGELTINYTTNRFASASHGSIGMNLLSAAISAPTHDKKKDDTRTVSCQILGIDWQVEINLDPKNTNKARAMVTRINQIFQSSSDSATTSVPTTNVQDVSASLAKLAELKSQGLLSDEEFEKAKSRLLS